MPIDWDDHYASGQMPWDSGKPDPHLVSFVEHGRVHKGRALDVGCGTGTNALWLTAHGFDVLGVDIAQGAIARAKAKRGNAGQHVQFRVLDFLTMPAGDTPFDLVFDRGVFHVFDDETTRARFAAQVARALAPGAMWLSLAGSTEGPPREEGPPRRTARELVAAIEPVLEIVQLRAISFDDDDGPRAWQVVSRRRAIAAQPSTRHDG